VLGRNAAERAKQNALHQRKSFKLKAAMPPADDWTLKEYQPKDSPQRWFFRKNIAPAIPPKHRDYGFLAFLTFHYDPRDESGLPSVEDEELFFQLEESRLGVLEADSLSIHVAAVTKNGVKDFLFYTRDPHLFLHRAEQFKSGYPQFRVACDISPDPQWDQYEDFP
jgi:hypothetical protein